jgi:hypothetical protein
MNRMSAIINIIIKSSVKSIKQTYPLQITSDFTIFQIKQEIEKLEKVSADWIILWHPKSCKDLDNDSALVKNTKIGENDELWAEFRYKLDESPPRER